MSTAAIIKAITEKLRAKYPGIKVENVDIKNAPLPSFYVRHLSDNISREADGISLNVISFEVIYFSETRYEGYIDLLVKKNNLMAMFNQPLKVDGYFVLPYDLEFNLNVQDYVLNTTFNVDITEYVEDSPDVVGDNDDTIDTLYVNGIKETEDD